MTTTHQAYRFALDPTPAQARELARHAGAARFAFNWGLALVKAVLEQRAAEATYGIPAEALTPALGWSLPALRRAWNTAKPKVAPWWAECSKESYNTGLDQLARGLRNWSDSRSGTRAGRKIGFPRFKSKRNTVASCRFTTGTIRVEPDHHHVSLPRLGRIKTHESTRKLARCIEGGSARILSATVRQDAGHWFVSFTCQVQRSDPAPKRPDAVIGVDVGLTHLAVLSEPVAGVSDEAGFVANPKHLHRAQRALRRASRRVSRRRGPDRHTGQNPSKRWEKANRARTTVHHRIRNLRRDGLHKLTTGLATTAGTVVVEDLNVAGMLRNRRLARGIADAGFGEIRRQLDYKTPKLPLHIRVFCCDDCGLVLDRDVNAARNLAALAAGTGTGVAGDLEPHGSNGRGANQKTPPGGACGPEASTPHPASRARRGPPAGNGGLHVTCSPKFTHVATERWWVE